MKSKKGMVKLRNRIVWCFIIVVFAVRVFDSAIDSTWDEVIALSYILMEIIREL